MLRDETNLAIYNSIHDDLDLHLQGQIRVFGFLLNGFLFIFVNFHTLTEDGESGCGNRGRV